VLCGGSGSAQGATGRARNERQVDVQTRDEQAAAVGHVSMVPQLRATAGVSQATGSIAARMWASDSSSGVTEVSTTTSARTGGSYGSLTPVNWRISPARALA
jgi:hypothetical protein